MKFGDRFRWNPEDDAAAGARAVLPDFARDYFKAGRKAAGLRDPEELHRFRLETKRFRYTLELFRPLYTKAFERRLASLREIQDALGSLNDCAVTSRRLRETEDVNDPEIQRLLILLESREAKKGAAFREYWVSVFDAPGEERRWMAYLSRYAGRSSTAARSSAKGR